MFNFYKLRNVIGATICAASLFGLPLVLASPGDAQNNAKPAARSTPAPTVGTVKINAVTRNDTKSQWTLVLAENKQALLPIVISDKASKQTQAVAAELAEYLGRMSGAKFEVTTGDGSSGIVLGTIAEFPTPALNNALQIFNGFDGKEAYAIRTRDKRLLMLGATDLGVNHAAYRLLHELGARWFFPHKAWEVVPQISRLQFNREITDRPSILARDIWFEAGSGGEQQNKDYTDWKRRNHQAQSFVVNAGHNLDAVIRENQAEFDKHPEYYALTGGKRQGPQLELANPVVRQMILDYARNFFKANPTADMVSIDPADTTNHSESPESLAMGSVSDRIFIVANEVAKMLQKEFPGKMVGLYSYNAHWDPPSFKLEPNVHVLLAGLGQGKYTGPEREAIWPTRSNNLGFYEYFSVWLWSYDKLPGSWTNDIHGAQGAMRSKIKQGATSISAESTSSWGSNGRGYYVVNKLMWNPDINVDAIAQDFYDKAFGPGAASMKRYYERLDPGNKPFMSGHLLGMSFRDVDEASKAAKDRPDVLARLDQIKLYLRYVHLDWKQNREGVPEAEKPALSAAIMSNLFRTREYALTSWEMIRQNWGGNKYPGNPDAPAWMMDKPYTREEIEADFQEGLQHFAPKIRDIGVQLKFSEELIPVQWNAAQTGGSTPAAESKHAYQGGVKYVLYSLRGEPLEFLTWAGDAWGGINRFTITDAKGKEIAKGQPKNKETMTHKIAVPGAGRYYLDYNDGGSYWSFTAAPGKVATIPLGQTNDYRNSAVMQDMYFYVPKGTKHIEYYYSKTAFHPGGPHQVLDPSGKVQKAVDVNGDYITIAVPAGMDGKLWRFHDPVLGFFWFNNVPNYFAASPDALLVPRELAAKDGLVLKK